MELSSNVVVFVESPFSGNIDHNTRYAMACSIECSVVRGEMPYASHLQMTQHPRAPQVFVPDYDDQWDTLTREQAIEMSQRMRVRCDKTVFYEDLGWSTGMQQAKVYCEEHKLPYEVRKLNIEDLSTRVPYLTKQFLTALIENDRLKRFLRPNFPPKPLPSSLDEAIQMAKEKLPSTDYPWQSERQPTLDLLATFHTISDLHGWIKEYARTRDNHDDYRIPEDTLFQLFMDMV